MGHGRISRLALSYGLQSLDREFREVESSDEDILRLTYNNRLTATPSTRELDNWSVEFDEGTATLGLGLTTTFKRWAADLSVRQSDSNGDADFTAFPGGLPLGTRPAAQDFSNYEDTELTAALAKLGYKINDWFSLGLGYLWEDYIIDSFILQDPRNYLPGALLLNGNIGDYEGEVVYFDVGVRF